LSEGNNKKKRKESNSTKKRKVLFLKEYVDFGGNITLSCKAIGISRQSFYKWLKEKRFKQEFEEVKLEPIENVESKLYATALEGNVTAMIYYLKNNYRDKYFEINKETDRGKELDTKELIRAFKATDGYTN